MCGVFVLPEAKHLPPHFGEISVSLAVARDVAGQLRGPPVRIRLRSSFVVRTAVPKASVDKDDDSSPDEGEVRAPTRKADDSQVDPVTHPTRVEDSTQLHLWSGVPPALRCHPQ